MWFAHRFRFIGILTSVCTINTILLVYLFNIDNGATLLVYQPFIIAYFLVCYFGLFKKQLPTPSNIHMPTQCGSRYR